MYFKKSLILIFLALLFFTSSCGAYKKVDQRQLPDTAKGKARKNVDEGRGAGLGGLLKGGGTNYEFSTSNPMWRASLEVLDFIPMATVDYSGGMIISDWYTDNNSINDESIKISIRFLSNEVRSESLKIIVHKKVCKKNSNCTIKILDGSTISKELRTTIIRKAALLEVEAKNKNKK